MPQVRKLDPEEVKTIEHKGTSLRKQRELEYDAFVQQFATGDYGEITLDGESRLSVRHRFNAAALRAGMDIKWLRGGSDTLKFKVESSPFDVQESEQEAEEEQESAMLAHDDGGENGTTAALAEFELPEPEPTPEPVKEKKAPARKRQVTSRAAFHEAP